MSIPDDLSDDELFATASDMGAAAHVAADESMDPEIRALAAHALGAAQNRVGMDPSS